VNSRYLILIVAIGSGLIILAPTAERAGQSDKAETPGEPARDVKVVPASEDGVSHAKLQPASFDRRIEKLKDTKD
jgi:hypothetical protein